MTSGNFHERRRERGARARRVLWLLALVPGIMMAPRAGAQTPQMPSKRAVRLELSSEVQGCRPEAALRAEVAKLMRRSEPFTPDAAATLAIAVRRQGRALVADARLRDEAGAVLWSEEMVAPDGQCATLVTDLALAIAIELGPEGLPPCPPAVAPPAPEPPATRSPSPGMPGAPSPPVADARALLARAPGPERVASSLRLEVGTGAVALLGLTPRPGAGAAAVVRLRWPTLSIGLEGRRLLPADARGASGSALGVDALSGMLVGCWHRGWFEACGLVEVGVLGVRDAAARADDTFALATTGARVGVEVPIWRGLRARAHADVALTLTPTRLRVNERVVWTSPRFVGGPGAGLVASFW